MGGARVARYRDGRFENLPSLGTMEDAVTAMARARDGALVMLAGIVNGPLRWTGSAFELAPRAELPARSPVTSVSEAADGRIWMGTQDAGLFYLEQGRVTAVRKGLPDPSVAAVLPVGAHDVWVATSKGIARWNGSEMTVAGLDASVRRAVASTMTMDRESNVWIGTADGLLRVNATGVARLEDRAPSAPLEVTASSRTAREPVDRHAAGPRAPARQQLHDLRPRRRPAGRAAGRSTSRPRAHLVRALTAGCTGCGTGRWAASPRTASPATSYSLAGSPRGSVAGRKTGGAHPSLGGGRLDRRADVPEGRRPRRRHRLCGPRGRDGTVWAGTLCSGASGFRTAGSRASTPRAASCRTPSSRSRTLPTARHGSRHRAGSPACRRGDGATSRRATGCPPTT